jgi:EAL domain-containing protein (putative c-di-GMP-specific phosphodiesterase class I)
VVAVEALLRWNDPVRGMVEPVEFIHVAEETGLIVAMGDWVIRNACRQLHQWRDAGLTHLVMNVNISAAQLHQPDFLEIIVEALRENELPPGALQLEITESVAVQNIDLTMQLLRDVKRQGIGIAIDDFGTGQSSLVYLRRFPIDTIKIDQAFVRDVTVDDSAAAIVSYVINLAHTLRLEVVAEGVETEAQYEFLKDHQCDRLQGFLFSQPMPAAQAYEFALKHRG